MQPSDRREAPEYLLEHLRAALAADESVTALDVEIRLHGNEVTLIGSVPSHDRRNAIETVARSVLPHYVVVNEVQVVDLDGTPEVPTDVGAVRIAAVGDIHLGVDSRGKLRPHINDLSSQADMLLLAGDLTRHGTEDEAQVLADELENLGLPIVAVLGNHDYHSDQQDRVAKVLQGAGVIVLEKSSCVIDVDGTSVGIAGAKGFGGGFIGASGSEFGEPMMKAFIGETRDSAQALEHALNSLDTDIRIALMHFAPVDDTLRGERLEIYPWMGSYLLAEAVDHAGCDFVFHGHAHAGSETGLTAGGVPVRNVAQPVLGSPYKIYCIEPSRVVAGVSALNGLAG